MKKNLGVYMSIFFFIIGIIIFWESLSLGYYSNIGPGPGFLPRWTGGIITVSSVIYFFVALKKENIDISKVFPKNEGLWNVINYLGSILAFIILAPLAGFTIACIVTLFLLFSRGFKWHWSLGFSAIVSLILFWVFGDIFGIPLPVNSFGW